MLGLLFLSLQALASNVPSGFNQLGGVALADPSVCVYD